MQEKKKCRKPTESDSVVKSVVKDSTMSNAEIQSSLKKLFNCKADFTVILTGKKSSKVNGLYDPNSYKILLHNKNFQTKNEIMYTAIHELTHHILITEKNVKSARSHSGLFWATFYDLIDKAIELGFYSRTRSEETKALVESAKKIQNEIINAQKKLGEIIAKIFDVEREAQRAADEGKTVEQVKAIAKQKSKVDDDDFESPEQLQKEKNRLERTIERLNDRLVQVEEQLLSMTGGAE